MYRRRCWEPISGSAECLQHINLRSIGVIFPLLWLDHKKSVSCARSLSSCGFVHLEPRVFRKGSKTDKTHLNIKAPEESVGAL